MFGECTHSFDIDNLFGFLKLQNYNKKRKMALKLKKDSENIISSLFFCISLKNDRPKPMFFCCDFQTYFKSEVPRSP